MVEDGFYGADLDRLCINAVAQVVGNAFWLHETITLHEERFATHHFELGGQCKAERSIFSGREFTGRKSVVMFDF